MYDNIGICISDTNTEMGTGCFATRDLPRGHVFQGNDIYTLPCAKNMPAGTGKEFEEIKSWNNDMKLVDGTRRQKYWPVLSSLLSKDSLVAFDDTVVEWKELASKGFSLISSYPQAFLVHSSDPFMFVNDLSHSSD